MRVNQKWEGLGILVGLLTLVLPRAQADMWDFGHWPYQPLVTVSLGPDFLQAGQAQTLSLLPPFQNYYTNPHSSATVIDGGLFVGVERTFNDQLQAQLGLSAYMDSPITVQGDVWQFASSQFDTLSYTYQVQHKRVMVEGKVLTSFDFDPAFHPYVSWGAGVAFNSAEDYQETPLIAGAVATPAFANHTETSLTWSLGAGFDYTLTPHTRLGLGYQFADLGSASLGPTSASTTGQSLNLPHLYTSQLRCQFTWLI